MRVELAPDRAFCSTRVLLILSGIMLVLSGLVASRAAAHNPHGTCSHSYYSPNHIIQGDSSFDDCRGMEYDQAIMYGYAGDDDFNGLGATDELQGGQGDDQMYGDGAGDYLYDNAINDNDVMCDGNGSDLVDVEEPDEVNSYYEDAIARVSDGISGEPTRKDPEDDIMYWSRSDCPLISSS